jgi:hypothetical protein
MKRIQLFTGGHSFRADDFNVLTDGMIEVFKGICNGLGLGTTSYILQGCVIITTGFPGSHIVSEGFIYHNGEVYPVDAQIVTNNNTTLYWVVQKDILPPSPVTYADSTLHDCHFRNKMILVDSDVLPNGIYTTVENCRPLTKYLGITPQKGIIMYSGLITNFDSLGTGKKNTPVEGWALCNGNNGTPDLKGRFIVGYDSGDTDYNAIGKLPATSHDEKWRNLNHRHSVMFREQISLGVSRDEFYASYFDHDGVRIYANIWKNTTSGDISGGSANFWYNELDTPGSTFFYTGDPASNILDNGQGDLSKRDIRPPYYTLAYIMKL